MATINSSIFVLLYPHLLNNTSISNKFFNQLRCEEKLLELSKGKFPYVIVRLPDVLGPRDSTNRFWLYQMLLQYLHHSNPSGPHEILIPKAVYEKRTSYVYVKDVAIVVHRLLKGDIKNEIFNIGRVIFKAIRCFFLF
jgi:nucleoside-diphosphate-sugar epimerase